MYMMDCLCRPVEKMCLWQLCRKEVKLTHLRHSPLDVGRIRACKDCVSRSFIRRMICTISLPGLPCSELPCPLLRVVCCLAWLLCKSARLERPEPAGRPLVCG